MRHLKNSWYVIAQSPEVTKTPLSRTILGEALVIFRGETGRVVAMHDRCPHRFVPLSRGRVVGDAIECGYHGLKFGSSGTCTHNPHGDIPPTAKTKAYAVAEKLGFVWIWAGEPSAADASKLPAFGAFDNNPAFVASTGYLYVPANYELITDNLLDLSHVEYIHPTFKTENVLDNTRSELLQDGNTIHFNRWKPACAVSTFLRMFWQSNSSVGDARANMTWHAPGHLYLDLGVTEVGAAVEAGVTIPFIHLLTPETDSSTHYFWGVARNCHLDDVAMTEKARQIASFAFENEDEPMIAAQQKAIGSGVDLMLLNPVLLLPDVPAVRARRILDKMIKDEQAIH